MLALWIVMKNTSIKHVSKVNPHRLDTGLAGIVLHSSVLEVWKLHTDELQSIQLRHCLEELQDA